jgi:putative membrane protein
MQLARAASPTADRSFYALNALVSVGALSLLAYVLLLRHGSASGGLDFLPAVNATLNGSAALCLVAGYVAIRRGAQRIHRYFITSALGASALFFASYLAYHYVHGDTHYPGGGWARGVYLLILASHVLLSLVVVPLALTAFYFAWRQAWTRHKRVTRVLLPVWLYVSATGVLIFFLLRAARPA